MREDGARRCLVYFDRRVLARYQAEPDKYAISDDGVEGSLTLGRSYVRELEGRGQGGTEIGELRYGFRRLADGRMCIAVMTHDWARLPEQHKHHWVSELLPNPVFADCDPVFAQLEGRWLKGSWEEPVGTIPRLYDLISLINGCFPRELPLFRRTKNPLFGYPLTDNRKAYREAIVELNKLLWENLDAKAVKWLGEKVGKPVKTVHGSGSRPGVVKQLDSVVPDEVHAAFIEPTNRINKVRTDVHRIGAPEREHESFWHVFDQDLREVNDGLNALLQWTEQALSVDARRITGWRDNMASLPEIVGPPSPDWKDSSVRNCVGRTVERVEFGRENPHPEMHEREAVVLHFTDGSALGISIGSNAQHLASQCELTPPEFRTDIRPWWVGPKPPGAD